MLQLLRMQGGVSSSSSALGSTDDTGDDTSTDGSVLRAYRHLALHPPTKSHQIYSRGGGLYEEDDDDDDETIDYTVNDDDDDDTKYGQRYHHHRVSDQVGDDDPYL